MQIDITNGFYQSDSLPFSNQRCVNLYVNIPQVQSLTQGGLWNTEGLRQVAITGYDFSDNNRGGIEFQNQAYFVNGTGLYRVDKTTPVVGDPIYTTEFLGAIDGDGRVSMAENGTQIIIINELGDGYTYTPLGSPRFEAITAPGFIANGTPEQVTYVDRYFVVTTDEKKAIISAVGDGTSWNALDFISAEADPDDIVAPFVHKNQLYLLGTITGEQYQNIGGAGVPFVRVNGFVLTTGCTAPNSVINAGPNVYWVGRGKNEGPSIWAFNGGEPQKISTTAIDNKLHELTLAELTGVFTFAYAQRGNQFIHFTTPYNTFVYNANNGRWHERVSCVDISGTKSNTPCRIRSVVQVDNDLLTGDSRDGKIGIVDENEFTEYDQPYVSFFSTAPLYNEGNAVLLPEIELNCETGVGNELVRDPKVRLEISRDGVAYENPRTRSLGAVGDRKVRPIWFKNGRCASTCTLKFTISDAVKRRIYGINVRVKALR